MKFNRITKPSELKIGDIVRDKLTKLEMVITSNSNSVPIATITKHVINYHEWEILEDNVIAPTQSSRQTKNDFDDDLPF